MNQAPILLSYLLLSPYESGLEPARFLVDNAHLLPKGKALDVAGSLAGLSEDLIAGARSMDERRADSG